MIRSFSHRWSRAWHGVSCGIVKSAVTCTLLEIEKSQLNLIGKFDITAICSRHRDLLPSTKFVPLIIFTVNVLPTYKSQERTPLLTLPRFNSLYFFYYSSISHLLDNPFRNDLSHNLSFWHLNTHSIIDPNIEKFQKGHRLGHKMFENVRLLLYKESNYNGVSS